MGPSCLRTCHGLTASCAAPLISCQPKTSPTPYHIVISYIISKTVIQNTSCIMYITYIYIYTYISRTSHIYTYINIKYYTILYYIICIHIYVYIYRYILQHFYRRCRKHHAGPRQATIHEGANGGAGGRQAHQRMEGGNLPPGFAGFVVDGKSMETLGKSMDFLDVE